MHRLINTSVYVHIKKHRKNPPVYLVNRTLVYLFRTRFDGETVISLTGFLSSGHSGLTFR
jgi:hypothetical protein